MTHLLEIRDDEDTLLYNLLFASVGNAAITSLSSRQIIPLNDGRWEERFRIFSGSANMAPDVSCSILDLDKTVKSISDYGENPAYNAPIWLYEKNEGEAALTRRAPLFSASQQPVQEGAIGQLLINSGYTGLLTIERGDWEDIELTTVSFPNTPALFFDTIDIEAAGSVDGRVDNLHMATEDLRSSIIAFGIRDNNFGIDNFQPCVNLGIASHTYALAGTDSLATSPTSQPTPTNNNLSWNLSAISPGDTVTIPLSDVSQETLDATNQDYVGKYVVFLRYGIVNLAANPDLYFKLHPFYGFGGDYKYSDPVYIQSVDTIAFGNLFAGIPIGEVSIPTDIYFDAGAGATSLADFTFGIDVSIVGTAANDFNLIFDSLILLPTNNVILTSVAADAWDTSVDVFVRSKPDGSIYLTSSGERVTASISADMTVPNGGGLAVYYNEGFDTAGGTPSRDISLNYHPRYNSTSG